MAFDFNKLKSDIVSMGKDVGDKVSDVSAVAKVKLDIRNKESYMEKQFTELDALTILHIKMRKRFQRRNSLSRSQRRKQRSPVYRMS